MTLVFRNLPKFKYKKSIYDYTAINYFYSNNNSDNSNTNSNIDNNISNTKDNNDKNNKVREEIICSLINKSVPISYFDCELWDKLNNGLHNFINNNIITKDEVGYELECKIKGGRKCNYDFELNVIDYYKLRNKNKKKILNTYKVEFKYNSTCCEDIPQFVSPYKPSEFLSVNYECYFYDNYLDKIFTEANKYLSNLSNIKSNTKSFKSLELPSKPDYIKTINKPKVNFMKQIKQLYDKNPEYNKYCKELSKESIQNFMNIDNENGENKDINNNKSLLLIDKLNKYFINTQSEKIYMIYKDGKFNKDIIPLDNITIKSYKVNEKYKNRFDCISVSGDEIQILLRWKNGNGIQFPAFQISYKSIDN
jgi:hypothetical protein